MDGYGWMVVQTPNDRKRWNRTKRPSADSAVDSCFDSTLGMNTRSRSNGYSYEDKRALGTAEV